MTGTSTARTATVSSDVSLTATASTSADSNSRGTVTVIIHSMHLPVHTFERQYVLMDDYACFELLLTAHLFD